MSFDCRPYRPKNKQILARRCAFVRTLARKNICRPGVASDFGSEGWGFESLQARILSAV